MPFKILLCVIWVLCFGVVVGVAQADKERVGDCAVSGVVKVNGKPVPNAVVSLVDEKLFSLNGRIGGDKLYLKARTDAEGRYRFDGLVAGAYVLNAHTPAYVELDKSNHYYHQFGRLVSLKTGESLANEDFALIRGGVITGRITDQLNNPLVGYTPVLIDVKMPNYPARKSAFSDDRGVYRFYGLEPGKYKIGVGSDSYNDGSRANIPYYPMVYFPDVANQEQAKWIEVEAGSEVTGIDIKLKEKALSGYTVSGRVIDADTQQPVADITLVMEVLKAENSLRSITVTSDNQGKFSFSNINPGAYTLSFRHNNLPANNRNYYFAEPLHLKVTPTEPKGILFQLQRGGSISGKLIFERASKNNAELDSITILAEPSRLTQAEIINGEHWFASSVASDGSFRMDGLRAGAYRLRVQDLATIRMLPVLRTERDGVVTSGVFQIAKNEAVSGLRVVVGRTDGGINGVVKMLNGPNLPSEKFIVFASTLRGTDQVSTDSDYFRQPYTGLVGKDGRFQLEKMSPGEYEIWVETEFMAGGQITRKVVASKQRISVSNEQEATITLIVNPEEK